MRRRAAGKEGPAGGARYHGAMRTVSICLASAPALALALALLLAACGPGDPSPSTAGGNGRTAGDSASEPAALSGRVQDRQGRPLPGVKLNARLTVGIEPEHLFTGIAGETDEEGEFSLPIDRELRPDRPSPVWLTAEKPGYVTLTQPLSSYRPGIGLSVDIVLDPAGTVEGSVVDPDGRPVPDAIVYAIGMTSPGVEDQDAVRNTTTGADGGFRLSGLPGGNTDLGVVSADHAPALIRDVRVIPRETVVVTETILLTPGVTIAGRVVDREGEPVADAWVQIFRDKDLRRFKLPGRQALDSAGTVARTDEDGRFTGTGLAPGNYTVEASHPGMFAVQAALSEVPGGTEDVSLVLGRDRSVEFFVVDARTGAAVTEFRVAVNLLSEELDASGRPVYSESLHHRSPTGTLTWAVRQDAIYGFEFAAEGYEVVRLKIGPVESDGPKQMTKKVPMPPRR